MAIHERSWPIGVAATSAASAAAGSSRQRVARPSDVSRMRFRTMMMIASDRNCYWHSLVAEDARRLTCC